MALSPQARFGSFSGMLGQSPEMQQIFLQIARVSDSNVSVLIHGESGTGKELVARAIHLRSSRARQAFVALNSAAIPEGLTESELFGHEKGAYTGAVSCYQGKVQQANKGTLFLDEVGDLGLAAQAKLLRVVQERRYQRIGSAELMESDFRLIAATNKNLSELVEAGRFRQDLYFRLAVFEIEVPPLRERREDIYILASQFASDLQQDSNFKKKSISREAVHALLAYDWPGNVRELQNAIQRALLLCDEEEIQPEHLPSRLGIRSSLWRRISKNHDVEPPPLASPEKIEEIERKALVEAVERCGGNLSKAIRELQIGRGRLYRKLKKYGLMNRVEAQRKLPIASYRSYRPT